MSLNESPPIPMPTKPGVAAWEAHLRALCRKSCYTQVRPWILTALACCLDIQGRGLDAAEVRAVTGRLRVSYWWHHLPTGLMSRRTFPDRGSAWRWMSRKCGQKRLRDLVARGKLTDAFKVVVHCYEMLRFGASNEYLRYPDVPAVYHHPSGSPYLYLPVDEFTLDVGVYSGYAARVAVPAASHPAPPNAHHQRLPTVSRHV